MTRLDPVHALLNWGETQPDHPAVIEPGKVVTYGQFARKVRQLAAAISRCGAHPRVMVHLPQSADAYAAMFATLMAGGVYSPINLEAPPARRALIRDSFEPQVIVARKADMAEFSGLDQAVVRVCAEEPGAEALDAPLPRGPIAYVIFTSGSTGTPKGVMIPPDALDHYMGWAVSALGMTPADRCSQHPNIGFDLSVIDIYATLCSGATLVPLVSKTHRLMPAEAVREHGITVWVSVPSVIDLMRRGRQMTPERIGTIRKFYFCGEPLLKEHLDSIFEALPDVDVINAYGPTEATVSCTELWLNKDNYAAHCAASVAIGDPIPGMRLELVGDAPDVEGELAILGPQLALGYWRDEDKTQTAFKPLYGDGERAYHTGDWAGWQGRDLYFKQRIDRQVKVHGNRLELGDVDAALRQLGVVAACTVFVGGKLISFVEGHDAADKEGAHALTDGLNDLLPHYAIPSEIRFLEHLPRSANDKIDALALKELVQNHE